MLNIIYGRSGTGKTETLLQQLYSEAGTKEIVMIVPEQNSFQTEKRLLDDLGAKKSTAVLVLSFRRLYDKISELYGGRSEKRIDDGDKAVLMSMAVRQVADQLTMYDTKNGKNDIVELMLGAVNEYKMCAIAPSELQTLAGKTKNHRLAKKLSESAIVYEAYNALIENTYSDPDDDMAYLYRMLCEHPYFVGKTVYIDAFNGFSGQEQKVLECIIAQADRVWVTLGCDNVSASKMKESFFLEPCQTRLKLKAMAEKVNVPVERERFLDKPKRFKTASLEAVEESVFRFDGDPYDNDGSVRLYCAEDEYDEVQQLCRDISALVRKEQYAYRDITVIGRDLSLYQNLIETEFEKYGIPFFMSSPQQLESKPLIRLVLGAFDIVHSAFDTEKIFAYLKTGLTALSDGDIFELENYVYMWSIRGKAWHNPFTMNPDGNTNQLNEEKLQHLESVRQQIVEPLEQFREAISHAENGGEISKAVFYLLEKTHTAEQIQNLVGYLNDHSEVRAVEEQIRIWDMMMNMLDRMYHILETTAVDSKRYAELLQLMIKKSPVSDIPQTLDSVTIGTAGNIRSENPRAVFVIGAVEDVFPPIPTANGIFTDSERAELIDAELPLYDTLYAVSLKEKYIAYSSLSAPSEHLYVSYYSHNTKGESCNESEMITELQRMFLDLSVRNYHSLSEEELFYTKRQSYEVCALEWNEHSQRSESLKAYFFHDGEYAPRVHAVESAAKDAPFTITGKSTARRLFGNNPVLSASQIESYYKCPFAYFCQYGLRAFPRQKADMDARLYGSVVHYILEQILQREDFNLFQQNTTEQLKTLIEKYLKEYIENIGGEENRTARFQSKCNSIADNILLVLQHLIAEFQHSKFVPTDFELSVGGSDAQIPAYELTLPQGGTVQVVGKVDRVDTYTQDGEKYIRIVDYKTGNKTFKLSEVMYGLNLQMLLYLSAIIHNGGAYYGEENAVMIPAGILYMPSTPSADTVQYHNEDLLHSAVKERDNGFKMNGMILNNNEIIKAMDSTNAGRFIPAVFNKNGQLSKTSSVASNEDFARIFDRIDKEIIEMAESLREGKVERYPSKGVIDACQYCDYKSVCGYEDGKKVRQLKKRKAQEVLDELKAESGEENEESDSNDSENKLKIPDSMKFIPFHYSTDNGKAEEENRNE